jgi:phosphohistidine swiveling domain-containing protein
VTRTAPADLADRIDPTVIVPRPLPAQFRLTPDNTPVAVAAPGAGANGVGAGGGSGSGPVHVGENPPEGVVLVVTHLDPRLAPVVPRLAGLVAETGSPLSHLAILAREHGVPTVVGHAGATDRYQAGQVVEVDGTLGTVRVVADAAEPAQPAEVEVVEVADAAGDSGDGSGGEAPSPGPDGTTVVALPTRIVIDLTDDGAEPGATSTRPNGDNVIPIGARR